MKVMVIPEDPTLDQYILKPVVEHLFEDLNRPARVAVLKDPHLRGVSQALDKEILSQIFDQWRMMDVFLLIVDRDCESRRQTQLDARIAEAASRGKILIGCLAIEEVEAWALALHREELSDGWREVRRECHPKDRYFDPLARRKKWRQALGRGRVEAMRALRGNWRAIKNLCPELEDLRARIADRLQDLNS
jgi:hypothetical protein